MSDSTINIPKNNTFEFTISITGVSNLSTYTATLTVKEALNSPVTFTQGQESITNSSITFKIPYTKNNITAKSYIYGISVTDGTNRFDIDLDNSNIPNPVGIYNILPVV